MSDRGAAIIWFRQDLRLADNPALAAAAQHSRLIPLYIWPVADRSADRRQAGAPCWRPGAASRWWLHDSLASLADSLAARGSRLLLRLGSPSEVLTKLCDAAKVKTVYCNALTEPHSRREDAALHAELARRGIELVTFNGSLLHDPAAVLSRAGTPYLVYGAFWRALSTLPVTPPTPAPRTLPPLPEMTMPSATLAELALKPKIGWDSGLRDTWRAGEAAAQRALAAFGPSGADAYAARRDAPAAAGTSRLSPYLHFGELSPRQVWAATSYAGAKGPAAAQGFITFRKQLVWREFSHNLLYHQPQLTEAPLRREFLAFPWEDNPTGLAAWQRGETGYPIVDAGMRELWQTGWMHNRVRMIVASFLVKDLRIHWLEGARWFWDTLVDADLANNTQSWQWTAGCGADAAPFYRIFNPTLQGKTFDPDGSYLRRWLPELATLPKSRIHEPWAFVPADRYPRPIVEHASERLMALKCFAALKGKRR